MVETFYKQALSLVKAQARVRIMNEQEMLSMVQNLALGLRGIFDGSLQEQDGHNTELNHKAAIKERSITCLECGKSFRVITKKHLLKHNLSLDEYREKYGYKRGLPLVCKSLQRDRRKKMREMKLWERRGNSE